MTNIMCVGCERSASDDHAALDGPAVKIVSTSPDISVPLIIGDNVRLLVEVAFTQKTDRGKWELTESGTFFLYAETPDHTEVAGVDMELLPKGSGTTQFALEFLVPNTKEIHVSTGFFAGGQTSYFMTEPWVFKVVSKREAF